MTLDRRQAILAAGLSATAASLAGHRTRAATSVAHPASYPPGRPGADYTPVITPNGASLPYTIKGGVKVFHLVSEEVDHEFAPGLQGLCWGYNGRCHGPTIEAVEGDHVRIFVTNHLPAPTTVHWHGLIVPAGMDGVSGLTQKAIPPGETWVYEFPLVQHGTHMYHSHHDEMTQIALGLTGLFVIHPRRPGGPHVDRDFAMLLSEWSLKPGSRRPDPNEMTDFNLLTINGKVFPGTEPLVVRQGQRVRLRIANLSPMDHHPIHLHGHTLMVTATDGGPIPASAQWPEVTILVPVGTSRDVEFIASNPGDWALHCHMTHHTMNQMGHGLPNMIGVNPDKFQAQVRSAAPEFMAMGRTGMDMGAMRMANPDNSIPMQDAPGPFGPIEMGGMFTIVKVRPGITSFDDPGWWTPPPGSQARQATDAELSANDIPAPKKS